MKINDRINELVQAGHGKTTIKAVLTVEGFKKADIDQANIPSQKANEIDAQAIMSQIIEMDGASRKDIATALNEQGLCSYKTAMHILSLMKFVVAYHDLKK